MGPQLPPFIHRPNALNPGLLNALSINIQPFRYFPRSPKAATCDLEWRPAEPRRQARRVCRHSAVVVLVGEQFLVL